MSLADELFIENCRDIIANGVSDEECHVRPHWEDGTPAHTIKKFCIVNRYDLQKEFPIMTLRRVYYRSAIDEILWIYQKKSNRVADLSSHIWDAWADENGTIGKAYGYQLGVKHHYPEGDFDQVDKVLYDLKHDPNSRRIMTNTYNHADLSEMRLAPCAYSMTFNVTGNRLNAILNQRSQDMLTANNWNVCQYAALLIMFAEIHRIRAGRACPRHCGRAHLRPPHRRCKAAPLKRSPTPLRKCRLRHHGFLQVHEEQLYRSRL